MSTSTNGSSQSQRAKVNSAKRLHAFLNRLRSSEGANLFTILPELLGITRPLLIGDPNWAGLQAFTLTGEMIVDVDREIRHSRIDPEQQAFHQRCLPGICGAMSPLTCYQQWKEGRGRITDVDLTRLENVDMMLRAHVDERQLERQEFDGFVASIDEALDCLLHLELPNQLKDFIASQLLKIKQAVDQYQYRGMIGIQEELVGYLGLLGSAPGIIEEKVGKEDKTKLFDVLNKGNVLMSLAHNVAWTWPHLAALGQIAVHLIG